MRTIINIHAFLRNRTFGLVVALVAILSFVAAACSTVGSDTDADDDTVVSIVATTTIWGDVVSEIVGDLANVEVLMPIGADPHSFQASARQAADLQKADLVVANGLGLEASLTTVLENTEESGTTVLYVADHLDPIPFSGVDAGACAEDHDHEGDEHDEDHDEGHGDEEDHDDQENEGHEDENADEGHDDEGHERHDHGACDPHVWMDPIRVQAAVVEIVESLERIDPDTDWRTGADAYMNALDGVFDEMESLLGEVPVNDRRLVTNHESIGYLADRFGYEVVGAVIPGGSTLADPSSQELTDLVALIKAEDVPAIFSETTDSDVLAQAISAEFDGSVVVVELFSGSLGGPDSGAATLAELLVTDATRISESLTR